MQYRSHSKGFRTLRLNRRLLEALRSQCKAKGGDENREALVFARPDGRPLGERTVETFFERVRDGVALPSYSFHSLRHTFASLGLQAGIDIVAISKMLPRLG